MAEDVSMWIYESYLGDSADLDKLLIIKKHLGFKVLGYKHLFRNYGGAIFLKLKQHVLESLEKILNIGG